MTPYPGRNDPCWCGSTLKFKNCHFRREREIALPPAALSSLVRDAIRTKRCLHPEASKGSCTKVIDAHSIQRAHTLAQLVDSTNHVLTFSPYIWSADSVFPVQRRGWREASTFTGFCGLHDAETFGPIENGDPPIDTQGCFLFCYRALCHELHLKHRSSQAWPVLFRHADRGQALERQYAIQSQVRMAAAGVERALVDLERVKAGADESLLRHDYSFWRYLVLTFQGPLSVATAGAPTPNSDMKGGTLQVLHDLNADVEHIYISVVAGLNVVIAVLGWRPAHSAPAKWVDSLRGLPNDALPGMLVQYVFAHLENVFFSRSWWDSLSPENKAHVERLAATANPYYFTPGYIHDPAIVPWRLLTVTLVPEST